MSTIYTNGRIITMAEETQAQALANMPEAVLEEKGLIAGVGSFAEMQALASEKDVRIVDLQGKCLMPGFIDAHSHVSMLGQKMVGAQLDECRNFSEIISTLKEYIERHHVGEDEAVIGYGYDYNFLEEHAHPDKRVLDQVSKTIPIFILDAATHVSCCNSAALALGGIDENTPDPEDGVIARIEGTREPSGYMEEQPMRTLTKAITKKLRRDPDEVIQAIHDTYLKYGITTAQDGGCIRRDFNVLKDAADSGKLKMDIVCQFVMAGGSINIPSEHPEMLGKYQNRLKIGGYKLILDGSVQGRTAWMTKPYLGGDPDYCAYPQYTDETLRPLVKKAVSENIQLYAHCNGDACADQFLNAYEAALQETENKNDLRPVMVHCQTVRNDQLDRIKRLGMLATIFVGHVWYWGDIHMKNLGPERANHISPVKDAMDRGINCTFHQDTPVTVPDMLHSVWCAVNRQSREGRIIGADQAVSVYDALKCITVNAAYQYFEEASKGSIEKGKRADLAILEKSPLDVEKNAIKDIKVLETIKDGESIYRR